MEGYLLLKLLKKVYVGITILLDQYNLTSVYYNLPDKDKVYIWKYYHSLVDDLNKVTLHAKLILGEEYVSGVNSDEAEFDLRELFIEQLGEEIQEELWETLLIDIGKIADICHECYAQNLKMTVESGRRDFPDFLTGVIK